MKNKTNKVAQRSHVHVPHGNEASGSDDEPQPEYGNVAIVAKPQKKHVSPRTINTMLVGMTRHDPDRLTRIKESEASVDQASSSDEIDARTSLDGSLDENLFDDQDVQKALESRDVMDQQGDAQEDQIADDSTPELESDSEDSASDKEGDECTAAESEDNIVDETVSPSPTKIRTRSKSRKVIIPAPVMCSNPEDGETSSAATQAYSCQSSPATGGWYFRILPPKLETVPKYCQQEACS